MSKVPAKQRYAGRIYVKNRKYQNVGHHATDLRFLMDQSNLPILEELRNRAWNSIPNSSKQYYNKNHFDMSFLTYPPSSGGPTEFSENWHQDYPGQGPLRIIYYHQANNGSTMNIMGAQEVKSFPTKNGTILMWPNNQYVHKGSRTGSHRNREIFSVSFFPKITFVNARPNTFGVFQTPDEWKRTRAHSKMSSMFARLRTEHGSRV